jgi:hypothetical protein
VFSLTTNQRTILSALTFQPSEQADYLNFEAINNHTYAAQKGIYFPLISLYAAFEQISAKPMKSESDH